MGEDLEHVKEELNSHALTILPRVAGRSMDDRRWLALVAAANSIDYRMPWIGDTPRLELDTQRTLVDPAAVEHARRAGSIVILLDNAGEAVFDLAYGLVKASQGVDVTLVAKERPYETDVTYREVLRLLPEVAEVLGVDPGAVRVASTGTEYPAPLKWRVDEAVVKPILSADLVVSKGIANLEALMETCWIPRDRTVVALRAKCPPIARALGTVLGRAVARLGYECR